MKGEKIDPRTVDFHVPVSICRTEHTVKIGFLKNQSKEILSESEDKVNKRKKVYQEEDICWLVPEEVLQNSEIPQIVKDLVQRLANL